MRAQILQIILGFGLVLSMIGCQTNSTSGSVSNVQVESADTVIRLAWSPVTGARGYVVFRDNSSAALTSKPLTEPRFEDVGLTNGRTYTYTIAWLDQNGQIGARSAPIQATPKSR